MTKTYARSNSYCRTGGNLKTKGSQSNSHYRTGGNLKTKGQKPVPGPFLIVKQVETLKLKDSNLCLVQFILPDRWKP